MYVLLLGFDMHNNPRSETLVNSRYLAINHTFTPTTRELLPRYIPTYLTLGLIKLSSFFFVLS